MHKHLNLFSQHVTAAHLAGHLYAACLHMLVLLFVLKEEDSGKTLNSLKKNVS